jgi:hypothetical protein
MVKLAFYIKPEASMIDRLIRWRTRGEASHCEIVIDGFMYSSSPRDGGVRSKPFTPSPSWRLIELFDVDTVQVKLFYARTCGLKYDGLGVLIGQLLAVNENWQDRWFCSEWCAAAIGYEEAWRFSPALLEVVVKHK